MNQIEAAAMRVAADSSEMKPLDAAMPVLCTAVAAWNAVTRLATAAQAVTEREYAAAAANGGDLRVGFHPVETADGVLGGMVSAGQVSVAELVAAAARCH